MPSSNTSTHSPDETTLDWSNKLSNERLRNITKTRPIRDFCYIQQLKYIGHICCLGNSELHKQVLFDLRMPKIIWFGHITNKNYDEEKLTNASPGPDVQT